MKFGFIKPTYPGEKRVALLPQHITSDFENELVIEKDFGSNLQIADSEYEKKGCLIESRENIFKNCEVIFCLKLLQPTDYDLLRDGQMIIGWTHPTGSGTAFYQNIAKKKNLKMPRKIERQIQKETKQGFEMNSKFCYVWTIEF